MNKFKNICFIIGLLLLALLSAPLTALAAGSLKSDRLKVVTTFTVIADMARGVAGDAAEVVSITRPGAEIHNYQPTPRDILKAQDADLILWNGLNLERWFEQFFANLADAASATISDGIEPLSISGGEYDGKPNPHAWMSLSNGLIYVDNIAAAFAKHDPANAATYKANAETYKLKLKAAVGPLRDAILALPEDRRWLVTSEGAFSYLARDYGLKELFIWPINADQQGTPRQVQAVIDGMREHKIGVIFSESTISPKPAQQIARETGANYGGVLYVDSLSEADGPVQSYIDLLRVTSQTILDGLTEK